MEANIVEASDNGRRVGINLKRKRLAEYFTEATRPGFQEPPAVKKARAGGSHYGRSLVKCYLNFKESGVPQRLLCYNNGEWTDFPKNIVEAIRKELVVKKETCEIELNGSPYVLDFLHMCQVNLKTGYQLPIAWIDEADRCFFPDIFAADDDNRSGGNQEPDYSESCGSRDNKLQLEIEINDTGCSVLKECSGESNALVKRIQIEQKPRNNSFVVDAEDSCNGEHTMKVDEEAINVNKEIEARSLSVNGSDSYTVWKMFIGEMSISSPPDIVDVYPCRSSLLDARRELFEKQVEIIGKIRISKKEIGRGSDGTIVREGFYEDREVAVKRLVRSHQRLAEKEIQILGKADSHPNIVRLFGFEENDDFVYIALERCFCSFDVLIRHSKNNELPGVELFTKNGRPSKSLIQLLRDIVEGVNHLHGLSIIHRDLKPRNVLITNQTSMRAKIADMGISKRLIEDKSSLGENVTGCGTEGWQAPEYLNKKRQTRAIDQFSLGCILFWGITGGKHPFGEARMRNSNILTGAVNLQLIAKWPEAMDLIFRLLSPHPESRPTPTVVLCHPFFWDSDTRVSFLCDVYNLDALKEGTVQLIEVENKAAKIFNGSWDKNLDNAFRTEMKRMNKNYNFKKVRELVRFIRNKEAHFVDLPAGLQIVDREGFDSYFTTLFPNLLIEVYLVLTVHCKEDWFRKYYKVDGLEHY